MYFDGLLNPGISPLGLKVQDPGLKVQDPGLKVSKVQFSYTWTSGLLDARSGTRRRAESQRFSGTGFVLDAWRISCTFEDSRNNDLVSVSLRSEVDITAKVRLSMVNSDGKRFNQQGWTTHCFCEPNSELCYPKYISLQKLAERNPDRRLILLFEICINDESSFPSDLGSSKLNADIESLLKNPEFSDVTISTAGGGKFHAHQAIMASRSSVFSAMLKSAMQESKTRIIEITDSSKEAVQEMLNYIYSGKSARVRDLPEDLLYLAEKYDLKELKAMSEEVLQSNIRQENCFEVLDLAQKLNSAALKDAAMHYFAENIEEIMKTDKWNNFAKCNGILVSEIFACHLKKK